MKYALTENAVNKLRGILSPRYGNSPAPGASPATISPDDFPAPFTVRWSQSEASGSGSWVIWLPDAASLVMYDSSYLTPTGVAASQILPGGWYTMDDVSASDDEVWLVVHIPDDTSQSGSGTPASPSAEISNAEGQATTGEKVANILIAEMEVDQTTSAKRVKQFVDSSVIIGAGGGDTVTPDGYSVEYITTPSGETPDADEGELQIKGWKTGTPVGQNLVNCLQNPNTSGVDRMLIPYRLEQPNGKAKLFYMPLGPLYDNSGTAMTVEFVADIDWDQSNHILRKRLRVLNLQTGAVTDKAGTNFPNGWERVTNTTPISSLLPSGS